eukprot:9625362-Ditylum_brightwellii.AAC.1
MPPWSGSNSDGGSFSDDGLSSEEEEHGFQNGVFDSDRSSDEGKSENEDDVGKHRTKKQKRKAQRNANASKIQTKWKKSGWVVAEYGIGSVDKLSRHKQVCKPYSPPTA